MKVLFYCQHLLGIGHVTRSLSLVNEMAKEFSVTFVQGGPELPLAPAPGVRRVQLPPLLMRESDSSLYDPSGERSAEEIFRSRREILALLAKESFDAVVVELFPFGRKKFGMEILHLLDLLPSAKAICSLRDILVEKSDAAGRNRKIAELVEERFDAVLVHSDPALIRLEDSFSEAARICNKVHYTGFVAEPLHRATGAREKKILLSLGGGIVGAELYRAAAKVVENFSGYHFQFVIGPYAPPELKDELTALASSHPEVEVTGLLANFEEELGRSALSLSMAGYNTVMNLLNTRTPGLVLTYDANGEQKMRAKLLEGRGYLKVLGPEDLEAGRLTALMQERLTAPYPKAAPDLGGSAKSREIIGKLLR